MRIHKLYACIYLTICCLLLPELETRAQQDSNPVHQIGLQDYVETVYDESNGMTTSEANAVMQDSTGYIWVGSYGGLSRFNGTEFEDISRTRSGAPVSGVRCLLQDGQGRIWIGTNDSGLYVYDNSGFRQIVSVSQDDMEQTVKTLSVRSLAEDIEGRIYIGTTVGLWTVDASMTLQRAEDVWLQEAAVESLACDRQGRIWGTTAASQLFVLQGDELLLALEKSFFGRNLSYGLYVDSNGRVYLGTADGRVLRLQHSGDIWSEQYFAWDELTTGSEDEVNSILRDSQGRLWVCTDGGPGYFDDRDSFYKVNSLNNNSIMSQMCEDYEGNLWFAASRKGCIKLSRIRFKNLAYEADITNQTVNATMILDGLTYIGGDYGLAILDETREKVENELTDMLSGVRIRGLSKDKEGTLWIATYRTYGLVNYEPSTGEIHSYTPEQGMPHEQVRMSMQLSDGRIAAATNGGVAILRDGQVEAVYNQKNGIENEWILCLEESADHKLLAGSDGNGIYEIDLSDGQVRNLTTEDGLQSGVILRMVADAHQGVWISNGSQLALWDEEGIRQIPNVNAGTGSIFDIKVTDNYIWLMKSFGLIRISRDSLIGGRQEYEALSRKDGLTSSITANSWNYMDEDSVLYLCTGNGMYYIDLKDMYRNTVPPRVSVGRMATDTVIYYKPQDMELKADTQRITMQLDLLSFGSGDGILEYYLEGFDRYPIQISGSNGRINYTNLPGGEYVFHLRGYNADGAVSEDLTFRITKEKSLFERQYIVLWLIIGGLLLLIVVLIAVQYINRRRILQRQKEYRDTADQIIRIIAKTIDARDKYTSGHSHRVASYAVEIGRRYGLDSEQLEQLRFAALLHDIGKIGIPDHILNKHFQLTDEEYAIVKQHPTIGGDILKEFTLVPEAAVGALYHHERYDGKGYNAGLKGEDIPLYARIIAVADAYDAMDSTRVYQASMDPEVIYRELEKGRGTQFDAQFAEIMMAMMKDGFSAQEE
ncbi:MAG: HD domain-containing protein [bacterium]|nr:HD domain-containing protein [bacterium]MCM1374537.1 HD domain-containing protein [Muribaculum sp.]